MCNEKTTKRLRSVNVKMTREMILELEKISGQNSRSAMVRMILAAILEAYNNGEYTPFDAAVLAGQRSASRVHKKIVGPKPYWDKVIIWLPEQMHDEIAAYIAGSGLRPADFIRGAVIGYTDIDPMKGLLDGIDVVAIMTSRLEDN